MSDFQQRSPITTLHMLKSSLSKHIEEELANLSRQHPIGLILPSLITEMEGPALPRILKILSTLPYLSRIIVTLGPASEREFQLARSFFGLLPQKPVLIWNDGPRLSSLYQRLDQEGLSAGPDGKGRSFWMALGYLLAEASVEIIALHDCDIVTYDRNLVDRLVYPVVSQEMGYQFCKGFYARYSNKLHGRVTRLFLFPLLNALIELVGPLPILIYLDAFRYPLAGEFCITADLAWSLHVPSDWGLEIGVLEEAYRLVSTDKICQSELCERYDHKHQILSSSPDHGLKRMAADITQAFFRILKKEGISLSLSFTNNLKDIYERTARLYIRRYEHEALINGLSFNLQEEMDAIGAFVEAIDRGSRNMGAKDIEGPLIPDWHLVDTVLPTFLRDLKEAVYADNAS